MTKLPHAIDFAPWSLYPDRGCVSWPACLECPFEDCINTADKEPTKEQYRGAQVRREIVQYYYHGNMIQADIAVRLKTGVSVVERGLAQYRADLERARRKALALKGLPIVEAT